MLPDDDRKELVFLYGALRRGGPENYRMAEAEFVCPALVQGRLYEIHESPALITSTSGGFVMGDLYRCDTDLLGQIASAELPDGERKAGRFRKVIAKVRPYNLGQAEIDAWTWEWTGSSQGHPVLSVGDWMEHCIPRQAPVFTAIALLCLLLVPLLIFSFAVVPRSSTGSMAVSAILSIFWLLSPVAGLGSLWIADKRRERWRGGRSVLWVLLAIASIPALISALGLLLGLVRLLG
jgi:gamma-glutamylcyclotransferase (GGCT)/AIG2-like uncharacterized protein YtfP